MSLLDDLEIKLPRFDPNRRYADPELVLFYKNLESRHIWLDTDISWEDCGYITKYIYYLNRVESDNLSPIHLHIMSNGGDGYVMFNLYSVIKESKIPIYTYNEGYCHSAAFIVYLAGAKRFMCPYAVFIAHEGSATSSGSFRESRAAMRQYEADIAKMIQIIADETSLSKEEIEHNFDMNADWYINYEDAKKYNILKE